MGNDGGSIPKRRELVKEAAKDPSNTEVKEIQAEKLQYYWAHCSLSQKLLSLPIVSDSTGNLYNKDAVLENLLNSNEQSKNENIAGNDQTAGTVKSLRDVVEVCFKLDEEDEGAPSSVNTLRVVCPITGKRLGPGVKAVYLVPCGHAFAETAVREMPGERCLECNESYDSDNVIPILPASTADKDRLRDRAARLQAAGMSHSLKKVAGSGKKRKKAQTIKQEAMIEVADATTEPKVAKTGESEELPSDIIRNEGTASLTAKVLAEQEDCNKRRKMVPNENLKTLFASSNGRANKQSDFMTRGFSIPAGAKR
ncbi:MAG: hypothetical protein Q9220_001063 [cf. Caloplaca sp. 1 TL-2023]